MLKLESVVNNYSPGN